MPPKSEGAARSPETGLARDLTKYSVLFRRAPPRPSAKWSGACSGPGLGLATLSIISISPGLYLDLLCETVNPPSQPLWTPPSRWLGWGDPGRASPCLMLYDMILFGSRGNIVQEREGILTSD